MRQAPITDQPTIQPAMTVIIAQVGIGGAVSQRRVSARLTQARAAAGPDRDTAGQLKLVHGHSHQRPLAVEEVRQYVTRAAHTSRARINSHRRPRGPQPAARAGPREQPR